MRIWLYTHLENSPGNRLITEAAESRGHTIELVRPSGMSLFIGREPQDVPDLVFTRIGSSAPPRALANLAVLQQLGYRCVNSVEGLRVSRDKTVSYAKLAAAGVPIPKTVVVGTDDGYPWLEQLSGPPWIVKLSVSTKGQGVCLVESERSLRSVVDALRETDGSVLLQEYIAESKGADTRVLVLGGKARVAARRQAKAADEFRSNVYLGGRAETVELTEPIARVAEQAAAAIGLEVAGVDLLETGDGYLVVEVNGSPGLTASPHLPGALMDYLEEVVN